MKKGTLQGPVVAIIGRPNVGKSRLFNRLVGRRVAIVEDQPGVTRDRNYGLCSFQGRTFTVVDTGGLLPAAQEKIAVQVRTQTQQAIQEADLLLFLMDGNEGVTVVDEEIVRLLRRASNTVFYVVNKIDGPKSEKKIYDFYRLGVHPLYAISAEHGYGVAEMLEQVIKILSPAETRFERPKDSPRVAVIGRPNVGKSTLINTILGEERLLTHEAPGTTRDSIDTLVEYQEKTYILIDTAGMRKRGRIEWGAERYSVARTLNSLERCDVALLLFDGHQGVVEQDTKIVGQILKLTRGCIFLINKWDLQQKESGAMEKFRAELRRRFPYLSHVPTLFLSALTRKKVPQLFSLIDQVMSAYSQRINTADLNRFLEATVRSHPPPSYRARPVKLYYLTQTGAKPPFFVAFCNAPAGITPSYFRYLENQIRATFGFGGVPIKIQIRKRR